MEMSYTTYILIGQISSRVSPSLHRHHMMNLQPANVARQRLGPKRITRLRSTFIRSWGTQRRLSATAIVSYGNHFQQRMLSDLRWNIWPDATCHPTVRSKLLLLRRVDKRPFRSATRGLLFAVFFVSLSFWQGCKLMVAGL